MKTLCDNCLHDGRQTAATHTAGKVAVCDEHRDYHNRLAALPPLSAVGRHGQKQKPVWYRCGCAPGDHHDILNTCPHS